MILSQTFKLNEFTFSQTAIRKNIDNTPNAIAVQNLINLFNNVLVPLRVRLSTKYGKQIDIQINSGYRSVELNKQIGGSKTSQHCKGQAADTIAIGISLKEYYNSIKELVKDNALEIDQCIYEFDSWIHISYNKGNNRKQFLKAIKENGATKYLPD